MDVYRFGVKLFAADPVPVALRDFIPIFQSWIQKQVIEDHLLIDIHDYSHIHHGPGILLVSHEANFSTDVSDGRFGLFYYRKHQAAATERFLAPILKPVLQACSLLEDEPSLAGRLRFRTDELLFVANDRLLAPNDEKTFAELKPVLSAELARLLDARLTLSRASENPKERLAVRVEAQQSPGVKALLSRL